MTRVWVVWVEIDNAIISIVPGSKHELAGGTLNSQIWSAISMIPGHSLLSIAIPGATRFHCPGKRCKEGDHGIRCSTRVDRGIEWPNLMIEVGYSEPLSHLRTDAEWWLVNSGSLTRMVIIILVSDRPDALDIEVWELGPNPRRKTRHTPATIPIATSRLQIDNAANVSPSHHRIWCNFWQSASIRHWHRALSRPSLGNRKAHFPSNLTDGREGRTTNLGGQV